MLTTEGLAKTYRGRTVVQDVSLQVNAGEIVGLLGPNGAGKTTTFYIVVGLVWSDAGTVYLDGEALSDLDPEGWVLVQGERWRARADENVAKGEAIQVVTGSGLRLQVRKGA